MVSVILNFRIIFFLHLYTAKYFNELKYCDDIEHILENFLQHNTY